MTKTIDSARIRWQPVTVTFLEMPNKPSAPLQSAPDTSFELLHKPIAVSTYRELYYGVGEKWHWLDRMVMPDDELYQKINAANVEIFIFYVNNKTAGYIEFVTEEKYVEIQYFGLLPDFIGKGFGKYFLQWVIQKAWTYNPDWIQLNTCTLDHPNALDVYKKAGFAEVNKKTEERRFLV